MNTGPPPNGNLKRGQAKRGGWGSGLEDGSKTVTKKTKQRTKLNMKHFASQNNNNKNPAISSNKFSYSHEHQFANM